MANQKKKNFLPGEQISRIIVGLIVFITAWLTVYFGGWVLTLILLFVFWQVNTEFINIVRAKGINPSNKWIRFVSVLFFIVATLQSFGLHKLLPIKLFILFLYLA